LGVPRVEKRDGVTKGDWNRRAWPTVALIGELMRASTAETLTIVWFDHTMTLSHLHSIDARPPAFGGLEDKSR